MSGCVGGPERIKVAVVADSSGAASEIARALRDSGYTVQALSLGARSTCQRAWEMGPAVILLRTSVRHFGAATAFGRAARAADSGRAAPGLVLLTPGGSRQARKLAVESGALVHLVEPVPVQMLAAAVRIAAARAHDLGRLRGEVVGARQSLETRKAVEQAKTVLMRRLGLSEEEAHRRLQRESRNRNRKLAETAWHVIQADMRLSGEWETAGKRMGPPAGG